MARNTETVVTIICDRCDAEHYVGPPEDVPPSRFTMTGAPDDAPALGLAQVVNDACRSCLNVLWNVMGTWYADENTHPYRSERGDL